MRATEAYARVMAPLASCTRAPVSKPCRPTVRDRWFVDEIYVKVAGV